MRQDERVLGGGSVKVIFKGMKETVKSGCKPCGRAGTKSVGVRSHKELILPSGAFKMFRINKVTEVSDSDGEWLLEEYDHAFSRYEEKA